MMRVIKRQPRCRDKIIARFPLPHGGKGTGPCLIKSDGMYAPTALNARLHTEALRESFLDHYRNFGCIEHKPSKITSGIDPSVRFIGSHISVLKPYFNNIAIPERGVSILQDCVRTRNANNIGDPNYYPNWGSFFQSMGALVPYTLINEYFLHTLQLFIEVWDCPAANVVVRVSKLDDDLYRACEENLLQHQIETNTKPESYYHHSL